MTVLSNSPLPAGVPVSRTRARVSFLISALDSPRSERSRPDGRPIDATPAPGVAGDACALSSAVCSFHAAALQLPGGRRGARESASHAASADGTAGSWLAHSGQATGRTRASRPSSAMRQPAARRPVQLRVAGAVRIPFPHQRCAAALKICAFTRRPFLRKALAQLVSPKVGL